MLRSPVGRGTVFFFLAVKKEPRLLGEDIIQCSQFTSGLLLCQLFKCQTFRLYRLGNLILKCVQSRYRYKRRTVENAQQITITPSFMTLVNGHELVLTCQLWFHFRVLRVTPTCQSSKLTDDTYNIQRYITHLINQLFSKMRNFDIGRPEETEFF